MIVVAKLVGALLYPLTLALLVLLSALVLWRRRPRFARGLLAAAVLWLWLWSTPWLAERAAGTLESAHPPVAAADLPAADVIVLLGGLLSPASDGTDPDLNAAADRAWFAAQLWKAGKAPVVLCSGGPAPLARTSVPECPGVSRLLRDMGLPPEAILVEADSRTTAENARHTRERLGAGQRVLLVTSARHMPRALAAFRRAGIDATAAPTDHQWHDGQPFALIDLLPSPAALALSTTVWHEWLGRAWYSMTG